jgi:predicted RNase H-like HicB family nuclease
MKNFTAIIERGRGDWYVALRPEVDVASQGATVSEAKENLREALDLFFECASMEDIKERTRGDVYVTQV